MLKPKQLIAALDRGKVLSGGDKFSNAVVLATADDCFLVIYRASSGPDFPVSRGALAFCAKLLTSTKVQSVTVVLVDGEYVIEQKDFAYVLSLLWEVDPVEGEHGPYNWLNAGFGLAARKRRSFRYRGE